MTRITKQIVEDLAKTDYFDRCDSPACIAILPFVDSQHIGVEIGVYNGVSSAMFLQHCKFMYFIDPFEPCEDSSDPTIFADYGKFLRSIDGFSIDQYHIIKGKSHVVAPMVPDVDFVFIDGNHKYDFVLDDIVDYWPKIRPGGFISGHDYNHEEVRKAVNDFGVGPIEKHQYCWLIRKP